MIRYELYFFNMISLTPSHIIEYLFCPRFTYFEYVLRIPQYEDRHFKVQRGREVHAQKAQQNMGYLRRRIGVKNKQLNQYLTNDLLRGEVDEIFMFPDGSMAPLDYKFARWEDKLYETYRTQLYCYAWLIEENYQCQVMKGYLVYTRSKNKLVEIKITPEHVEQVKSAAEAIKVIIQQNKYPKATRYKRRCVTCTYSNICTK